MTRGAALRNDPDDFLPEGLGGLLAAHPHARWDDGGFVLSAALPDAPAQVRVLSGGGSGHEPLHAGFVGPGMLDAAVPGLLFTSPNAVQIAAATRACDQGRGVVHIVKNYTGDVMNFSTARTTCADTNTAVVLVDDDVATELRDGEDGPGRRGTAATILVEKVAGAAAARGDSLERVVDLAQRVATTARSMAVALAPGHVPTTGRATFDLPAGQMEMGVGIHGEPGTDTVATSTAAEIAATLVERVTQAAGLEAGAQVAVVINGLGSTTQLELGVFFADVLRELDQRGIRVRRGLVGSFVTSVNMHGVSLTLAPVDEEILELLDAPTAAPAWPQMVCDPQASPARMRINDPLPSTGEPQPWLSTAIERIQGGADELTELDRRAGDGDFGTNMTAAFGGLELPLRGQPADVLKGLAQRLFVRAGGTSGAVLGTLCEQLSRALADADCPAEGLARGLRRAQEAITELGGARPGQRTVIDALAPAADAAEEALAENPQADFAAVLAAAGQAATAGAQATATMRPAKGRASYLQERAVGVVDPGALLVSWLLDVPAEAAG